MGYKNTNEEFFEAVKTSTSIREALLKLNLKAAGAGYRQFRMRCLKLNINVDHFTGQSHKKGIHAGKRTPLNEVLIKNYSGGITSSSLKKRLIKESLLENKCHTCLMLPIWCNEELVLHIDHINGDSSDNRLENLQLLCPNCHSQTSTYTGKNKTPVIYKCAQCSAQIVKNKTYCKACFNNRQYKWNL